MARIGEVPVERPEARMNRLVCWVTGSEKSPPGGDTAPTMEIERSCPKAFRTARRVRRIRRAGSAGTRETPPRPAFPHPAAELAERLGPP